MNEIITLATVEHQYKTVVIDSFSELYNTAAAIAELKVGNEYARHKKEANKPTRQLMLWLSKLNLTVILICHDKDKWGKDASGVQSVIDTTYDGNDKLKFKLDLWLEMKLQGNTRRARIRKSRLPGFPIKETFDLTFDEFANRYGVDLLNATRETIHQIAGAEQASNLITLCRDAGIPTTTISKWCEKAGVESAELLPLDAMEKCLAYAEGRLS